MYGMPIRSFKDLAREQANFCRLFSNPRRVLIFWVLVDQELSVGAIAEAVGSSLQNISQHLRVLKQGKIVKSRREGQTIFYSIDEDVVADHCRGLMGDRFSRETWKTPVSPTSTSSKGEIS